MRREDLPPHKTATYVLPRWKVVYVSVPKAACTSIKWLIAELQEEDPARFHTARNAMDGHLPDGTVLNVTTENNGINGVMQATHRQNFLVPPRRHQSFPLVELLPK